MRCKKESLPIWRRLFMLLEGSEFSELSEFAEFAEGSGGYGVVMGATGVKGSRGGAGCAGVFPEEGFLRVERFLREVCFGELWMAEWLLTAESAGAGLCVMESRMVANSRSAAAVAQASGCGGAEGVRYMPRASRAPLTARKRAVATR